MKKILTLLLVFAICVSAFCLNRREFKLWGSLQFNASYCKEDGLKLKSIEGCIEPYWDCYTSYSDLAGDILGEYLYGGYISYNYSVEEKETVVYSDLFIHGFEDSSYNYGWNLFGYAGYQFSNNKDKNGIIFGGYADYRFYDPNLLVNFIRFNYLTVESEFDFIVPETTKTAKLDYASIGLDVYNDTPMYDTELEVYYAYSTNEEDKGLFADLSFYSWWKNYNDKDENEESYSYSKFHLGVSADFHKTDDGIKTNAGVYTTLNYGNLIDNFPNPCAELDTFTTVKYNFLRYTSDIIEFNFDIDPFVRWYDANAVYNRN